MPEFKSVFRSLTKSPGFTMVAVLTIAVGIGANTALYSVFDRLVLHPITLPAPSSLVAIWANNTALNFNAPAIAWPRYEQLRDHAKSFSSIANSAADNFTLTGNGEPEQLNGLRITASFFPTIGVRPMLGRNLAPEEDVAGGPNVCLLSHELWETRFGSRTSLVGENIQLNGQSWQVVGVLPPHLSNPFSQTQVFAPRVFEVGGLTPVQVQAGAGYAQPIARLKPGVTLAQAAAELAALSQTYGEQFTGKLDATTPVEPRDFVDALVGNLRPTFYTLLAAVGFVLLIACANVASLFLGRLASRHREIAVRQSLGATRGAIVQQFLAESLVFSVLAGGVGVILAMWGLSAVQSTVSSQLPPGTILTLDWRALAFTAAATLVSALLVGLAPAWQASKAQLVDMLKDGARGSSGAQGGRFRAALIVAEVALSVVLLVGSGLLLQSFLKLQRTPPGFDAHGTAFAFVSLPATRYQTPAQQAEFFVQAIMQLRARPQVTDAAVALALPVNGFGARSPYGVGGRPILPLSQRPLAGLNIVSEDYFRTMRITFREGRAFTPADREGGPGACIINESLAKHVFPGESALGKILLRGKDADIPNQVVGVIADVKTNGLNAPVPDEIYYALRQLGKPGMTVLARTGGNPAALQALIRSAVAATDTDQPISLFQTIESALAQGVGVQRIMATLTAVFAGVALALAVIGLYSVLAYAVAQRTGEIGIRMALGAQPRQVIAMIMQSGLKLVAFGLVLGLAVAAGVARAIQTLLYNVQPLDPLIYGGVTVLFAVVAAAACLLPSLRASRIDPLVALRTE